MTGPARTRRQFLRLSGGAAASVLGAPRLFSAVRNGAAATERGSELPSHSSLEKTPLSGPAVAGGAAATQKLRGLMVDAARLPASMRYYERVVNFCAEWNLNALQFRLTDDQGSALRFESVPGLLTHKNAFTHEQMRSLVEYGQRHGVELIPEVESFGHTGYITRSPRYAHLLDSSSKGPSDFSGVIPVDPETLDLFERLYREVAGIFPSAYLHGGCDEVNWGGSEMSRRALATRSRSQIWAEYLNSLDRVSRSDGKNFIVWGDYVLHKEPAILGLLNKDIIVMDWLYEDTDPITVNQSRLKVRANGSRGIGAPALLWSEWGPRAGVEQLRNIDAYAESYIETQDAASLGVILTNWVPTRYLQNSIWDGFAYAAVAFTDSAEAARTTGFRRFVEKYYAAEWNGVWAEVFAAVYDDAPHRWGRNRQGRHGLALPVPWASDEELSGALKAAPSTPNPFTRLRSRLVLVEPLVRKHLADFHSFALSVEYLERLFWRKDVVAADAPKASQDPKSAAWLIQSIAARDRALAEALTRDWDRGRPADSSAKTEPLFGFGPKSQLLYQWEKAAAYSASLASRPDRFYRLLKTGMTG